MSHLCIFKMVGYKRYLNKLTSSKTIKNGGLFAIFSFFNRGISFLLLTVVARYISPSDYGELSLFNTLITLLGYFVGLSTAGYLGVSYFKENEKNFKEEFTAINVITLFASILILVFFITFYNWMSGILKVSVQFLFIGLLISFANVFVGLNLDYYRVKEKLSIYGLLSCSFALLNFGLTLYFIIFKDYNWHGQVYAMLFCNILYSFIAILLFAKNRLFILPDRWSVYRKVIIWGLPIIPHLASGWIKLGLDRYIIEENHTMSDVGLFSFAMNMASIIIMIGTAFNQTNSVNLYQVLSSDSDRAFKYKSLKTKERTFTLVYMVLVVIIVIFGWVFIPIIMPKYTECLPYFTILSLYGFFQCIYFLYCNYLFYYERTTLLMFITFGSSIIHLLLSFWLTKYSLYLTCSIYVISIIIVVILVYSQSQNLIKNKLEF